MNASLCACCERHSAPLQWRWLIVPGAVKWCTYYNNGCSHILSSKLSDSSSVSLLYLELHTPGPKQRQLTRRPCLPARTLISPEQWPENCPPTSIIQVSHHPRAHPLSLMHTHTHTLSPNFYHPGIPPSTCTSAFSHAHTHTHTHTHTHCPPTSIIQVSHNPHAHPLSLMHTHTHTHTHCPPTSIIQVSHHPRAHPLSLMHTHTHTLSPNFYHPGIPPSTCTSAFSHAHTHTHCPPTSIIQVSHHPRAHPFSLMHTHTLSPNFYHPGIPPSTCTSAFSHAPTHTLSPNFYHPGIPPSTCTSAFSHAHTHTVPQLLSSRYPTIHVHIRFLSCTHTHTHTLSPNFYHPGIPPSTCTSAFSHAHTHTLSPNFYHPGIPPSTCTSAFSHAHTHTHTFYMPFRPSLITPFVSLSLCLGEVSLFCLPVKQRQREQMQLQMSCEGEEYNLHKLLLLWAQLRPTLIKKHMLFCKKYKTSRSRIFSVCCRLYILLYSITFLL